MTGTGNRTILPSRVHHRYLELCVISQVANELKSGDLCSPLGDKFRDCSINDLDRFKLALLNQRHIIEGSLNEAIATVVNTYVQFPLQRLWGLGHSASADGMKWDLYPPLRRHRLLSGFR